MSGSIDQLLENKYVYAEISAALDYLGDKYKSMLPKSLLRTIESERKKNYSFSLESGIPLAKQNFRQGTIDMLTAMYLEYWCKDENVKMGILKDIKNKKGATSKTHMATPPKNFISFDSALNERKNLNK